MVRPSLTPVLLTAAGLSFVAIPLLGTVYSSKPPAAHTGGFGEPTCARCHSDSKVNDPRGQLVITGVPESYTPGKTYRIKISARHPEIERAGFQLAARFAEGNRAGAQAGSLHAQGERTDVTRGGTGGSVQYIHHSGGGTGLTSPGAAEWTVEWRAPASAAGPIAFHVVANAANGDDSEFGDWIYTRSVLSKRKR